MSGADPSGRASGPRDPRPRPGPLSILVYTTLYPNAVRPTRCVFVENRVRQLAATERVRAGVVAPVPWFPLPHRWFGRYGEIARVPRREERHGIVVEHPRYPAIPKVGMTLAPLLLSLGTRRLVAGRVAERSVDLIDAHYLYPDGVAAVMLGRRLGVPVTLTARGSDVNLIADHALPRRMILWAVERADGVAAVSGALARRLEELGAERTIRVLRNGVDLDGFHPLSDDERREARRRLRLEGPTLLSVGNLTRNKGHHLVIEALPHLPSVHLLVAGRGPRRDELADRAARLGVADRLSLLGSVPHEELTGLYNAADVLVLASGREGLPNVLLEALACGTPAVATAVGGVPEVIDRAAAGRLVEERTPRGIAAAVRELLESPPERQAVRAHARRFSWEPTTRGQLEMFDSILGCDPANGGS